MKYLDYPVLTQLSAVLSSNPSPEARVNARVEAYSIKSVAKERKMFKEMEEAYVSGQDEMEEMSFSPEMREAGLSSCFGRLDVKESRKVHFLLVSTLNSAFPEHDFSSLRPDHFTREISSAQVLSHLSSNLLGINAIDLSPLSITHIGSLPSSGSVGSSPIIGPQGSLGSSLPRQGSSPGEAEVGNPSLYRVLNEIVPLGECEVYSWIPEPEYDPHVDPEENEEASEYEQSESEEAPEDDMAMDIDIDGEGPYVSWGQAGMELEMDDVPSAPVSGRSTSGVDSLSDFGMTSPHTTLKSIDEWNPMRKVGGILWSSNYFFYSKSKKRVLFVTAWCRKRPSHERAEVDATEAGSLPLPISASCTPPTMGFFASGSGSYNGGKAQRPVRVTHHNLSNARPSHRRASKGGISKSVTGKSLTTSTIPIRGLATGGPPSAAVPPATPTRLATSAPTVITPILSPMRGAGTGIKPRQTTARMLINAAAAGQGQARGTTASSSTSRSGIGASRPRPAAPVPVQSPQSPDANAVESRIRKERSGSLTPGPILGALDKRVKV